MLETVVPAGGFDRQVAMLLGCHRRAGDKGPPGLMTEFNALLIGLSRGIDRFYLFTEDMRDQIFVPRSGDLQREGSALGVLGVSALPEGTSANERTAAGNASRRQMPWVRLWSESERERVGVASSARRICSRVG